MAPDVQGCGAEKSHSPVVLAMIEAARYHGIELHPDDCPPAHGDSAPSPAALTQWAQNAGLWARALRLHWRDLLHLDASGPVVLLLKDGGAALMMEAKRAERVIHLLDPRAPAGTAPLAVDELRLSHNWAGAVVLLRAKRGMVRDPHIDLHWLVALVLEEGKPLRDICLASVTISMLTIFPPLLVMATVNKVLQYHSVSTLLLLSAIMAVVFVYETLLAYARRLIVAVVGARLDAKLSLHFFDRLLRLPLDYFEHHPAGETMYRVSQMYRVRAFLTGKLMTTLLDLVTLCVLLPVLIYLQPVLAAIVLVCAAMIAIIILAFLPPLRALYQRVVAAENWKAAALAESIVGVRTVKSLALEPARKALWDESIAETGRSRLAFARLANWPQTLVNPIERVMVLGTMMFGAYFAIHSPSGYMVGSLFAFMMLSQRVAQPLVSLARLVEDYEEVGSAIGEIGAVLNRPLEVDATSGGVRPNFRGAIDFEDVTFHYPGHKVPALDHVSFTVPSAGMLGIVGRSGSGKSTLARLLQGINRDYSGFIKIDGIELRDINLRHLRQNLGVVLQENFLFRGSVCDNIIAGRPGLTLADVMHATRLAGAEEFVEYMPNGYQTYIEEGSPNVSGGQRQRLAIARALIHDPRILLLDEATSSLDPQSEAVVSHNLRRIARGRTLIIISHRLTSLIDCDQILVMDAGKVVDVAPHNVLTERCPIYRALWMQQNCHLDAGSYKPAAAVVVAGSRNRS